MDRSGDRPLGEMQPLHLQPAAECPMRGRTGEPEQHGDVGGCARRNRVLSRPEGARAEQPHRHHAQRRSVQLGEAAGQIMGVYLKSVIPEVPEFDDAQNRLQWKFRASRAQGTVDDEIAVAFA